MDQKRILAVVQLHCKQQVQQLLQESHSFSCSFSGMKDRDVSTYFSGKSETWETKIKTQFEVFPLFVKSLCMQNKGHVNTVLEYVNTECKYANTAPGYNSVGVICKSGQTLS